MCPYLNITGDGRCDDEANTPECLYDYQDCCNWESDRSLCKDCFCHATKNATCSDDYIKGFYLGDGVCDLAWNNVYNYFDVGDCCIPDPICMLEAHLEFG